MSMVIFSDDIKKEIERTVNSSESFENEPSYYMEYWGKMIANNYHDKESRFLKFSDIEVNRKIYFNCETFKNEYPHTKIDSLILVTGFVSGCI